jgi:hypothetical protein
MAGKRYVIVKSDVKDKSIKTIKPDALAAALTKTVSDAVNSRGSGKLTTKDKNSDGFVVTASVTQLKGNNNTPTRIDAKVGMIVMAIGSTASIFNATGGGFKEGISDVESDAEDLVTGIADSVMTKVIAAMLSH